MAAPASSGKKKLHVVTLRLTEAEDVFVLDTVSKERDEGPPPWRFTVGRDSSSHVVLTDLSVSLQHAEVEVHRLADRSLSLKLVPQPGALNGTFIGPMRCTPDKVWPVRPGAPIRFGKVRCKMQIDVAEGEEDEDEDALVAPGATQEASEMTMDDGDGGCARESDR